MNKQFSKWFPWLVVAGVLCLGAAGVNSIFRFREWRLNNPTVGQLVAFHDANSLTNVAAGGGSATAAGNSGAIQINEGDVFYGTNKFIYDITNGVFRLSGAAHVGSLTSTGTVTVIGTGGSGALSIGASNGVGGIEFSPQHNFPRWITNIFNYSNAAPGQVFVVVSSNNNTITWGISNAPAGTGSSISNSFLGARITKTGGGQSFASGIAQVTFQTIAFDTDNMTVGTNKLTIQRDGYYLLTGQLYWNASGAGAPFLRQAYIRLSGSMSKDVAGVINHQTNSDLCEQNLSAVVFLTANDVVSLIAGHNNSVSETLLNSSAEYDSCWLSAVYLNVGASSGVSLMTMTNFVMNQIYTNANANPILVNASSFLIGAAVTGTAKLELMYSPTGGVSYVKVAEASMNTLVTGLAKSATNTIVGVITNLGNYYFTNTSSGAGNSAGVVDGTGQITVFGMAGPAGPAGPVSSCGYGMLQSYTVTLCPRASSYSAVTNYAGAISNSTKFAFAVAGGYISNLTAGANLELGFQTLASGGDTSVQLFTNDVSAGQIAAGICSPSRGLSSHFYLPAVAANVGISIHAANSASSTLTNYSFWVREIK